MRRWCQFQQRSMPTMKRRDGTGRRLTTLLDRPTPPALSHGVQRADRSLNMPLGNGRSVPSVPPRTRAGALGHSPEAEPGPGWDRLRGGGGGQRRARQDRLLDECVSMAEELSVRIGRGAAEPGRVIELGALFPLGRAFMAIRCSWWSPSRRKTVTGRYNRVANSRRGSRPGRRGPGPVLPRAGSGRRAGRCRGRRRHTPATR